MQLNGSPEKERGQAALETAVVFPVVLLTLLGVIQACWMIYCASTLSASLEHAQYSISAEEAIAASDVNELLAERVKQTSPALKTGTLAVTNADVKYLPSSVRTEQLPDDDFLDYRIASKNESVKRIEVSAHVEYKPAMLVGVMPQITIVRNLSSNKIVDERFELG